MVSGIRVEVLVLGAIGTVTLLMAVVAVVGCLALMVARLSRAASAKPADLWRALAASGFFKSWWFEASLLFPLLTVVALWSRRFFE